MVTPGGTANATASRKASSASWSVGGHRWATSPEAGHWKTGEVPKKNLATVPQREKITVYLVDRPGAIQSVIMAGEGGAGGAKSEGAGD